MLDDFYTITHFRIALFDEDFTELLAYPSRLSDFCKMVRSDNSLYKTCLFCDYNGFCRCRNHREPIIYECHMGLTEIILPIISSNITIGYLMCGQIKTPNSDSVFEEQISELEPSCSIAKKELLRIYDAYPTTPINVIDSVLNFLQILTSYLLTSHSLTINSDSLAYKIDQRKPTVHLENIVETTFL